jgi:hypothetical protein
MGLAMWEWYQPSAWKPFSSGSLAGNTMICAMRCSPFSERTKPGPMACSQGSGWQVRMQIPAGFGGAEQEAAGFARAACRVGIGVYLPANLVEQGGGAFDQELGLGSTPGL